MLYYLLNKKKKKKLKGYICFSGMSLFIHKELCYVYHSKVFFPILYPKSFLQQFKISTLLFYPALITRLPLHSLSFPCLKLLLYPLPVQPSHL